MKAAATMRDEELARELLADRDRQAARADEAEAEIARVTAALRVAQSSRNLQAVRADEAEAKLASVLAVMEGMETMRAENCARQGRFAEGGESRLRTALGLLRVAIRPATEDERAPARDGSGG